MKSRLLVLALVAAAIILAVALGYLTGKSRGLRWPTRNATREAAAATPPDATPTAPVDEVAAAGPAYPLADRIEAMLARLVNQGATPAELAAFKASLLAANPQAAITAIRAFLLTHRDAKTGQDFSLTERGGTLAGAPTLRLLLLDVLGQVARRGRSDAAAQVSREILATKDSADEWALALRNVAWAEPQSRQYLAGKVRELLTYEPWRTAPSGGMLEAFDVAVFARDATLIPDLTAARTANPDLTHAADLALDRLADAVPLDVLTYLNTHPTTLNDRPFVRADYFAKADLGQPAQRSQVEIYLGRPDISVEEKTKLLKGLTTPASFVADSLVTDPLPADDGSARRAALGKTTTEWLAGNRFPELHGTLLEVQERVAP